mmetsp:Transcript_3613/g.11297  ORF Transcript_3613/g.11297 Transcript_3613/m.11297 type:complete len:321 (-) Transcript_3613:200-1162(-)
MAALLAQALLGVLPRVVLDLVGVLLPPLLHLPLHALLLRLNGVGLVGELVLRAHRLPLALLALGPLDHLAEGLHVPVMLGVVLLADAPPLGALLLEAAAVEGVGRPAVLGEDGPVVQVPQVLAADGDVLPIVCNLLGAGVALEVEHSQLRHAHQHLGQHVRVPDLVVLHVEAAERGVHELQEVLHPSHADLVLRYRERIQLPQVRQALDALDEVIGQVYVPEVRTVLQALDLANAVLLQEEAPQAPALLEALDLVEGVALGVECPEASPALEVLELPPALVMDVELVVQLLRSVVHAAVAVNDLPELRLAHLSRAEAELE